MDGHEINIATKIVCFKWSVFGMENDCPQIERKQTWKLRVKRMHVSLS